MAQATATPSPWRGTANLQFAASSQGLTSFQGGSTAPLKLMRAFAGADGRCELPLLHTAGGLVGGDQLKIELGLGANSRALITSVAAQKVYGIKGQWAHIDIETQLGPGADLEWLPQETLVFEGGLLQQQQRLELAENASWLGIDVVRFGRTARGETLGNGCWRSSLEIQRKSASGRRWELVDRLQINGDCLDSAHGLKGQPVLASLVWAAPSPLDSNKLQALINQGRQDSLELEGEMALGSLQQGLIARYRGPSSQAARYWFYRLWARIRQLRGLSAPLAPRVWPLQEYPQTPALN